MFSRSKSYIGLLWTGLALLCIVGCGGAQTGPDRSASLAGKVTFKGEPVEEGTVEISDVNVGGGGVGTLGPGGTFKIEGLLAGQYQVVIQPPKVQESGNGKTAPRMVPKVVPNIPSKYRSPKSSGFTADVRDGSETEATFNME